MPKPEKLKSGRYKVRYLDPQQGDDGNDSHGGMVAQTPCAWVGIWVTVR